MFQPSSGQQNLRMNQIDNFFMRNNNQVTPKRSYSPRLIPTDNQYNPMGPRNIQQPQYFPSTNHMINNKQNFFPNNPNNRVSVSPNNKMNLNFNRKPMLSGATGNISQLLSPRSKTSGLLNNLGGGNGFGQTSSGFAHQDLSMNNNLRPGIKNYQTLNGYQNQGYNQTSNNLLNLPKKNSQMQNDVQFVMSKGVQYCNNHLNKIAQFTINIQGELMQYCSVCASKLASQGFTVVKLSSACQLNKKSLQTHKNKPKPLPSYPEYRGNPFYQQIMQFLKQLVSVESNHYEFVNKFSSLQSHYDNQIQLTSSYYDTAIQTLQQMKQQHLADLIVQKQKSLQIAQIQSQQLSQNIQEINYMREDIEGNIPSIVSDIQQESFKQCVYEYRQKMMMLKHSIQEKQENLKDVTNYDEEGMRKRGEMFEKMIKQLWQEDEDNEQINNKVNNNNYQINIPNVKPHQQNKTKQDNPVSVKNMHQMLPKASVQQNNNGQGAFRHLFGDDQQNNQNNQDDNLMPIPSPQFKKI